MKKILLILLLNTFLFSSVIINDKYKYEIFNLKLNNLTEIITLSKIEEELEKQHGYRLHNHVWDIKNDKKFFITDVSKIGDILNIILRDHEAVAEVDEKRGIILIQPLKSFFINLPHGWEMHQLREKFVFSYPDVEYKISGNRLYAYGSEKQIKEIQPVLLNVEKNANTKQQYDVFVYPYETNEYEDRFIGYMKDVSPFITDYPYAQHTVVLNHNEVFGFNFASEYINLRINTVQETIIFDNQYYLKFDQVYDLGYVFKDADNNAYIVRILPTKYNF